MGRSPEATEYDDVGPISWVPSDTCISDTSLTEKIPPLMRELLRGEEIRGSKSRFFRKQKELKLKREHTSPNRSYRKKPLRKNNTRDVSSKSPSPRNPTRSRKSLRDDVIYVPLMYPAITGGATPIPFKSRTPKTVNCPLRIMELAEPTKRQCLETWRNKKDILPGYMVERLKKIVTEQKPIATIPDALTCFKIKRPILYKQKHNAVFKIRTKEDAQQLRLMCAHLSLAVAQKLIQPCTLELPHEEILKKDKKEISLIQKITFYKFYTDDPDGLPVLTNVCRVVMDKLKKCKIKEPKKTKVSFNYKVKNKEVKKKSWDPLKIGLKPFKHYRFFAIRQKILSSVVANSIRNTMKRGKINHNKHENQKILKDVSDRVTVWIATILEEVNATTLNDELEELREKEGPVYDILDDIIDEALDKCVVESEVISPQTSEDVFVSISDEHEETESKASESKSPSFEDEARQENQTAEVQYDDKSKDDEDTTTETSHHEEPSPQQIEIVEETTDKDNQQDTDSQQDTDVKTVDFEDEVSRTLDASRTGDFDRKVTFSPIDGRSRKFNNDITSSLSKNNLDNITFNPPKEDLLSDADETWPAEMTYPIYKVSANAGKSIESLGKIIELYKEGSQWAVDNPEDLYDESFITDVELLSQLDKTDDGRDNGDAATDEDKMITPDLSSYQQEREQLEVRRRQTDSVDNKEQSGKDKTYIYLVKDRQTIKSDTTRPSSSQESSMGIHNNKHDVASQNIFESTRSQNTEPTNSGKIFDDKTTVTIDGLGLETNGTQVDKNKQDLVDTYDVATENWLETSRSQNTETLDESKKVVDKTTFTGSGPDFNVSQVDKNHQTSVTYKHDVALQSWLGKSTYQNTEHGSAMKDSVYSRGGHMSISGVVSDKNEALKYGFLSTLSDNLDMHNDNKNIMNIPSDVDDTIDSDGTRKFIRYNNLARLFDYKVYEDTAPSWVGRGRGDQTEDVYDKIKLQMTENDIQQWCKNMKNVMTLLDKWNHWIITVAENYITLKTKTENCECHHKRCPTHMKHWAKLKHNVHKDVLLWTKLQKKAFAKLKKYNDIVKLQNQSRKYRGGCICATGEET